MHLKDEQTSLPSVWTYLLPPHFFFILFSQDKPCLAEFFSNLYGYRSFKNHIESRHEKKKNQMQIHRL